MANSRYLRAAQRKGGGGELVWTEPTEHRVRVFFGGLAVADSQNVLVLFNGARVPVYYFPLSDARMDLFEESDRLEVDLRLGPRSYMSIAAGARRSENAAFRHQKQIADGPDLSSFVSFEWNAMDAWFEEDEEVFQHARDPYCPPR